MVVILSNNNISNINTTTITHPMTHNRNKVNDAIL